MKKMLGVVAVAMFLCAGSAFAAPPWEKGTSMKYDANAKIPGVGNLSAGVEASNKSVMKNVTNETKIDGSQVMNTGGGNLDVGVVANSAGGEMDGISNKTEITNGSMIMNSGDGNMRVGTVQN